MLSRAQEGRVRAILRSGAAATVKTYCLEHLATAAKIPPGHMSEQGALFSYAESIREIGRAAARYVDKILRGAKRAGLPIEAYEHPELVINLKIAKALGLTIPESLLHRADQVFQ